MHGGKWRSYWTGYLQPINKHIREKPFLFYLLLQILSLFSMNPMQMYDTLDELKVEENCPNVKTNNSHNSKRDSNGKLSCEEESPINPTSDNVCHRKLNSSLSFKRHLKMHKCKSNLDRHLKRKVARLEVTRSSYLIEHFKKPSKGKEFAWYLCDCRCFHESHLQGHITKGGSTRSTIWQDSL